MNDDLVEIIANKQTNGLGPDPKQTAKKDVEDVFNKYANEIKKALKQKIAIPQEG